MTDYSERIPAAIAKMRASGLPEGTKWAKWYGKDGGDKHESAIVTREEVALADWAWETMLFEQMKLYGGILQPPPPALIAFTEKIERLP